MRRRSGTLRFRSSFTLVSGWIPHRPAECFADYRAGKILADDKTVEFYKVEEKGFIVCMLAKVRMSPDLTVFTSF